MKQKSFLTNLIIGFTSVILIASCTADVQSPHPAQSSQSLPPPDIIYPTATSVYQPYRSVYIITYSGVMQDERDSKVYLETDHGEVLLTSTPSPFADGALSVTGKNVDLVITYQNFTGDYLPFTPFSIKVVFQ